MNALKDNYIEEAEPMEIQENMKETENIWDKYLFASSWNNILHTYTTNDPTVTEDMKELVNMCIRGHINPNKILQDFYEESSDETLCLYYQSGRKNCGEILLNRYKPKIESLVPNESSWMYPYREWEDAQQELRICFLKLLNTYDLGGKVPFAGYVSKRLTWKSIDLLRNKKKREDQTNIIVKNHWQPVMAEDNYFNSEKELIEKIQNSKLPMSLKEILLLLQKEGPMTAAEIGRRLGIPASTARERMRRVRLAALQLKQKGEFL